MEKTQKFGNLTRVKDMKLFLKDLVPVIKNVPISKNSYALEHGQDNNQLKMKGREALAMFLLCAVANQFSKRKHYIVEDYDLGSGDGLIADEEGNITFQTQHIFLPKDDSINIKDAVLDAIRKKEAKGAQYCLGRNLIIFSNMNGKIDDQQIKSKLVNNNLFESYWLIAKMTLNNEEYKYLILPLKSNSDPLLPYIVELDLDQLTWKVYPY